MPLSPETGLGPDKNPEIVFPFPAGDRESKEEPMSEYRRDDTASWDAQEVRQAQGARRAACLVACIVMMDDSFRKSAAYARVWIALKICCTMRSSPCWIFSMVSYSSASPRDRRNASVHRSIRKDSPGVQICAVSLMAGITSI